MVIPPLSVEDGDGEVGEGMDGKSTAGEDWVVSKRLDNWQELSGQS